MVLITSTNGTCATDGLIEVGTHIGDGSLSKTARTATHCRQLGSGRVLFVDQQFAAGNEIGKGVLLAEQFAILIPLLPMSLPHELCKGINEAAIYETVQACAEIDIGAAP
jgi:hypothetical protein